MNSLYTLQKICRGDAVDEIYNAMRIETVSFYLNIIQPEKV